VLSLEIFNDQFRAAPPRQIALDGERSLLRLSEQVAQQTGMNNNEADLPPQADYQGIEFLEFAVDEETAGELETLFRQLGFSKAGRHRSKAVSVWRQGDINLVVNCDKEGFAHYYNLVHGPSVCALGFRVDDAQQALARSQAYRCESFSQQVGPGELEIPAIRGLENSLIYLVDRHGVHGSIWEVDFEPVTAGEAGPGPAGLITVDHLAQVMPDGQLTSWLVFYRAVFGFDASEQFDIVDPSGLIQSQVVEDPAKRIRIALNASQTQTTAARFVSRYYGGGVQQLAFATDDIVATLKKITDSGVPLLTIPENYYDDLEARFGLDVELLDTLRQYHILYDQDAQGGEFFHAYTQTFAERFYFEIVERRGYLEFGAVNAPIRIAAQTRLTRMPHPDNIEDEDTFV
jgi:4-hydroxyphenylpyruvate dioxygenase